MIMHYFDWCVCVVVNVLIEPSAVDVTLLDEADVEKLQQEICCCCCCVMWWIRIHAETFTSG